MTFSIIDQEEGKFKKTHPINLFVVQFLDTMTGYVLGNGSNGIIYKTTNGGLNWDLIHDFSPAAIFRDIYAIVKLLLSAEKH